MVAVCKQRVEGELTFAPAVELDCDLLIHILGEVEDVLLPGPLAAVRARSTVSMATARPSPTISSSSSSSSSGISAPTSTEPSAVASSSSSATSMASSVGHVAWGGGWEISERCGEHVKTGGEVSQFA